MTGSPHVLVLQDAPRLAELLEGELRQRGLFAETHAVVDALPDGAYEAADMALVVLDEHETFEHGGDVIDRLEQLVSRNVPTLLWGLSERLGVPHGPMLDVAPSTAGLEEVIARLETLGRYAPLIRRMDREIDNLQRLGRQLNRYFSEIDQELRLAGRLQRDFLPRTLPQTPPLSFSALYRPASWVSGDMYDVFRIDEQHAAVFLCDAMGHGIAAGLLTMFLRQALVAKRISGKSYTIVPPSEALGHLNRCLVRQKLPNCQFVTAVYAIINIETLEVRVARAGHPAAIHVSRNGELREMPAPGGLLGIPDLPDDFGEFRMRLEPGDKMVLYTDGVEDVMLDAEQSTIGRPVFTDLFAGWARGGAHALVRDMAAFLDAREGSLHPADDVTVVAMEVSP